MSIKKSADPPYLTQAYHSLKYLMVKSTLYAYTPTGI